MDSFINQELVFGGARSDEGMLHQSPKARPQAAVCGAQAAKDMPRAEASCSRSRGLVMVADTFKPPYEANLSATSSITGSPPLIRTT
jgi:hypothetical protein